MEPSPLTSGFQLNKPYNWGYRFVRRLWSSPCLKCTVTVKKVQDRWTYNVTVVAMFMCALAEDRKVRFLVSYNQSNIIIQIQNLELKSSIEKCAHWVLFHIGGPTLLFNCRRRHHRPGSPSRDRFLHRSSWPIRLF